jgi:phosphonate transport system ATP-binding protein
MGALGQVATVPSLWQVFPGDEVERAKQLLGRLGIGHKADERVYALSGGERQRVAIARALMQRPAVLLADEFVSQLDPVTSGEIMQIVADIAEAGVAVVVTTHELDIVARYAGRVLVLRDGRITLDRAAAAAPADELAAAMRA